MYFKMSRIDLLNMITIASKAISSNSPLPSLLGIKFDVKNDHIELTASDSDISELPPSILSAASLRYLTTNFLKSNIPTRL